MPSQLIFLGNNGNNVLSSLQVNFNSFFESISMISIIREILITPTMQ